MLKASSSGVVLCRLVHTHRQIVSCLRSMQYQPTRSIASSQRDVALIPIARIPTNGDTHCKEHRLRQHSTAVQSCQLPEQGQEGGPKRGRDAATASKKTRETLRCFDNPQTHFPQADGDSINNQKPQEDIQTVHSGPETEVEDNENTMGAENHAGALYSQKTLAIQHGWAIETLDTEELKAIIMDDEISDMDYVWEAYRRLASFELNDAIGLDPYSELSVPLLFKLSRRLVGERKRTKRRMQELYLRILAVLKRLRQERGRHGYPYLKTREWNILIYYSVTGHRGRIPLADFNRALFIYQDMIEDVNDARRAGLRSLTLRMEPDIVTYNSLIALAIRTDHQPAVDRVQELFRSSNLNPDKITRLSLIRHVHRIEGLHGVVSLLRSMKPNEIDADVVGAFLTYVGQEGSMYLVDTIYRTLRQNVEDIEDGIIDPGLATQKDAGKGAVEVEGIEIPRTVMPSEIVYNFTVQTYAYHDRPVEALQVFSDMLSTRKSYPDGDYFQPTSEVFRGLLLGFAKYGQRRFDGDRDSWTWDKLKVILDTLFELHDQIVVSERTVWWIMTAVRKTIGDEEIIREVWAKLKRYFRIRLRGRLKELDRKYGRQTVYES